MRRETFGFDDHQILEHRHRHPYWQIKLLTPESDIPWANAVVSRIEARAGSQSHVGAGEGGESRLGVRFGRDVRVRSQHFRLWGERSDTDGYGERF
jgi:hypothetical protein